MSKLVDKERLARLAAALDARMKVAVKKEEDRAMGVEADLLAAINAINNADSGLLKQAEALVEAEKDRAMKAEGVNAKAIADEITAARAAEQRIEGKADANAQAIAAINNAETGIAKVAADNLQAAKDELQGKIDLKVSQEAYDAKINEIVGVNNTQNTNINDLSSKVTQLETQLGDGTFAGLQEALDELKGDLEGADADLEARILANENALKVVKGAADVEGSIAKAQADAQKYADDAITALVDSAPEAMNTLKELADAIKAHGTDYEAYVATVSQNIATAKQQAIEAAESKDATLKADLQNEIAEKVKVETDRASGVEAVLRTDVDAKVAKAEYDVKVKALEDEDARIADLVGDNADAIAAINNDESGILALAKKYADEKDLEDRNAQSIVDTKQNERLEILEGLVVGGEGEGLAAVIADVAANKAGVEKNAGDIKNLQDADTAFEARVLLLENANKEGGAIKDAIDAAQEKANDNEEAIAKLNGGADVEGSVAKSIADALIPFINEQQIKTLLGSVVNSLALSMENNKMMLKLGGVDGITIHETSLDMATDDDIDAIIAGLDEE